MITPLWKVLIAIPISLFMDLVWGKKFYERPFDFSPTSYWLWELERNYQGYVLDPIFYLFHHHQWGEWQDHEDGGQIRFCKNKRCHKYGRIKDDSKEK